MTGFQSNALVEHLGGEMWRLVRPLVYVARSGLMIEVPSGLEYDGASIPRPVWPLLPSKDACLEFGTLHDWLFRVGPSLGVNTMQAANDLGWEALVLQKVGDEFQRSAIWEGLQLGAGPAWNYWRGKGYIASDAAALTARSF